MSLSKIYAMGINNKSVKINKDEYVELKYKYGISLVILREDTSGNLIVIKEINTFKSKIDFLKHKLQSLKSYEDEIFISVFDYSSIDILKASELDLWLEVQNIKSYLANIKAKITSKFDLTRKGILISAAHLFESGLCYPLADIEIIKPKILSILEKSIYPMSARDVEIEIGKKRVFQIIKNLLHKMSEKKEIEKIVKKRVCYYYINSVENKIKIIIANSVDGITMRNIKNKMRPMNPIEVEYIVESMVEDKTLEKKEILNRGQSTFIYLIIF